jgi:hypothetical protein
MFESYAMQPQRLLLENQKSTLDAPAGSCSSGVTGVVRPLTRRETSNVIGAAPSKLA